MTSAVSIHDLDLLYIKKTPSKGTRSVIPPNFTGLSQASLSGTGQCLRLYRAARQDLLFSILQLRNALPLLIRIRFHCPDSLFRFQKGTLFIIACYENMSPGRFGPGHGGYRPFRSCSYSSAQGLKVSANRVPVPVLPEPGETCLIPVSM